MKFYFDEDSAEHRLVAGLRSHALDDESHPIPATAQGRVLVSANARDFASLHREWLTQGRSHSGLLVIPQQRYSTGEIVRRMLRAASSGFDMAGALH